MAGRRFHGCGKPTLAGRFQPRTACESCSATRRPACASPYAFGCSFHHACASMEHGTEGRSLFPAALASILCAPAPSCNLFVLVCVAVRLHTTVGVRKTCDGLGSCAPRRGRRAAGLRTRPVSPFCTKRCHRCGTLGTRGTGKSGSFKRISPNLASLLARQPCLHAGLPPGAFRIRRSHARRRTLRSCCAGNTSTCDFA